MINSNQIKQNFMVVGAMNEPFGAVDQMEGMETIKLKKDEKGEIHFIPLSWVAKVDDKVHLNRSAEAAKKEWLTTPKADARNQEYNSTYKETVPLLTDHATYMDSKSSKDSQSNYKADQSDSLPKRQEKNPHEKQYKNAEATKKKVKASSNASKKKDSPKSHDSHSGTSKSEKKTHKM